MSRELTAEQRAQLRADIERRKSLPDFGPDTSIERIKIINDTQRSFTPEVVESLLDELKSADALNKHLELAIRKAEGCSEALRRKTEAAEKRIAELEARHTKLRESMAAIHNTIRLDGVGTSLSGLLSASKRAWEESAPDAGINLTVEG